MINEGHRLNAIRMLSHARYAFPLVDTPPQNAHAFSRYRLQKASFLLAVSARHR